MFKAVSFLHEHKIAHRDIKPDNIMLTLEPELSLKLIDFNIAHDLSTDPEIKGANGVRVWSAPETRKFASYDESCDLWSIGCILLYLCSGKPPTEHLACNGLPEGALNQVDESKREQIADLLSQLLKPEPSERIPISDALLHPCFCK